MQPFPIFDLIQYSKERADIVFRIVRLVLQSFIAHFCLFHGGKATGLARFG